MSKEVYSIRKTMTQGGKVVHVLMTNGNSEILEMSDKTEAEKLVSILNANSDSGWSYSVIVIKNI